MPESYLSLSFSNLDAEQQEMVIAWLELIGFTGFEQKPLEMVAFISQGQFNPDSFDWALRQAVPAFPVRYAMEVMHPRNWNEDWERGYEPVFLDGVCIRASFHPPHPQAMVDLLIDPKMSFGTGHHATTKLMVEQMMRMDFSGKSVLDFGCGTGILAILAAKCSARTVLAIDCDDWAVASTRENVLANRVVQVVASRSETVPDGSFDVILANITKDVLMQVLPGFSEALKPGGILVMSGFLVPDHDELASSAPSYSFQLLRRAEQDGWAAMVLKRNAQHRI